MSLKSLNINLVGLCVILVCLSVSGCRSSQASFYNFPNPVDTESRPITYQEKKIFTANGVYADNRFDGARLSNFTQVDSVTFQVDIWPENEPINPSPWYAFKIWSDQSRDIALILNYDSVEHRYAPWMSRDGESWTQMDSNHYQKFGKEDLIISLRVDADTLWISAQELINSEKVRRWCENISEPSRSVDFRVIGKSLLGRDLFHMRIGDGIPRRKKTIVILSRQHPPEVTGYFAMQAFIEEILKNNALANTFRQKYNILVFPLMNPDGVDLGHWRHNAGGIDLNRDWAYYHQPEVKQVADYIVRTIRENKSEVILGLDFHSTWYDIFYTNNPVPKYLPGFKDYWIYSAKQIIQDSIRERSSDPMTPVSKNWFHTQFGAVGITYEIGDNTPREYIKEKGKITALEMMKLLIYQ